MDTFKDLPVIAFDSPAAWRGWLDANHADHPGLWVRMYKKETGKPTVNWAEAVDEALCYGWIDSTKNKYDDESFLQRFSKRKPRSIWSKVNRDNVARLIEAGKMRPAGLEAVEEAKRNGQWEKAYDAFRDAGVPEDLQAVLDAHPEAKAFFEGLNKTNKYSFYHRIQSAKKPETRAKRVQWALDMCLRQEKIH